MSAISNYFEKCTQKFSSHASPNEMGFYLRNAFPIVLNHSIRAHNWKRLYQSKRLGLRIVQRNSFSYFLSQGNEKCAGDMFKACRTSQKWLESRMLNGVRASEKERTVSCLTALTAFQSCSTSLSNFLLHPPASDIRRHSRLGLSIMSSSRRLTSKASFCCRYFEIYGLFSLSPLEAFYEPRQTEMNF